MRFYHYTSASEADGILLSSLCRGHLATPTMEMLKPVVWLTTDPKSEGHGLTNGDLMSESDARYVERVDGQWPKNLYTTDKTRVRLTYELPSEVCELLIRFTDFCEDYPNGRLFAKSMGISGYVKAEDLDDQEFLQWFKTETKESTWWISGKPISTEYVTAVDVKDDIGNFHKYDCEGPIKDALEKQGFMTLTQAATLDIQRVVCAAHPLIFVKPLVFCASPDALPTVIIRGSNHRDMLYEIATGNPLQDASVHDAVVAEWVAKHRTELHTAWERAKESYYFFYPAVA